MPKPVLLARPRASTPTDPLWVMKATLPPPASARSPCSTKMVSSFAEGRNSPRELGPRILEREEPGIARSLASSALPSSPVSPKPPAMTMM